MPTKSKDAVEIEALNAELYALTDHVAVLNEALQQSEEARVAAILSDHAEHVRLHRLIANGSVAPADRKASEAWLRAHQ